MQGQGIVRVITVSASAFTQQRHSLPRSTRAQLLQAEPTAWLEEFGVEPAQPEDAQIDKRGPPTLSLAFLRS